MGTPILTGNRVFVTTTTTGTGAYQIGGAVGPTFRTPAGALIVSGSRVGYVVQDDISNPTKFEEAEGIYTAGSPNTLSRAQVVGGSNGAAAVNWGPGPKYIFFTVLANRAVILDTDGRLPLAQLPVLPTPMLPVSGNYSGNFPLTAVTVFLYCTIPAGTRYLWLNGYLRGAAPGGGLDVLASAVLRNAGDTANEVDFGTVGAGTVAPGGSIVAPLSMAWDLGGVLVGDRTMRLSAVTSNGQTLNLYEYRASLACGRA
jgi:hypothetical protein